MFHVARSNLEDSLTNLSITGCSKFSSDSISNHIINKNRILARIRKRDEVFVHIKSERFLSVSKANVFQSWNIFRSSIQYKLDFCENCGFSSPLKLVHGEKTFSTQIGKHCFSHSRLIRNNFRVVKNCEIRVASLFDRPISKWLYARFCGPFVILIV